MLIIDMPMPKYCADCPMIALSDRGMICLCTEALLEIDYDKKRPSWCPIKGVLPDEHGRLIDASTVIGIQQDEEDNDVPVTVDDYLGLQFPVPTIVPATERSRTNGNAN